MEMRLPALFSISTNTVDVDLDHSSNSDSSRTMDSYNSVPQSLDAGEDDPMPLAPLNPQTMPQMAPQVPQAHFHTQSPHPPQTPPPQTPPLQTPPPQTPPPQTPYPRSEDFHMDDINATPRAPPDMTPRAPQGPRNQPIMQQPLSPTIQKGKRRRVHDPEPGPSKSNDKTPGAQPTFHTGAQSNTQSNSQGPIDYLQALLNHQTKTMGELYHHLQNYTAEILQKQDQVLQKQDHKIDKVVSHLAQNTEILGRIGETLDMLSGKSKHKGSPGHQDEGDSQRHGSGSNQGPQPSNDGDAAAKPSDGGAAGSTTNHNNSNGNGEDGDDEGDLNHNPFFCYARKKQPARSEGVKHRPTEELKIKETMRKWLNEVMEGQDQLKEAVSQDKADEFTLLFKTNPLACPCSVDDFRYWIAGGPKSAWNKGASYVFVEILEKRKLIATPNVQTCDENAGGQQKSSLSIFQKVAAENTLFHHRREVIITFHSLESFLSFFDELGVTGMSSDDEDPGMKKPQVQYIIKEPKCSKTKYVSGLPANFYDAQWLEEQEPGWAKGGSGFVNEFVRPRKPIKLIFPADLLKTLKDRGYPRAQGPE
ncbi:hypothetical protein C8R41DRAFT_862812 [Lentinula lateritia]|uniref:Uncharacterized protein n=1 Tax=Lentinula lateritia TaxID=40482 RepID=A0ABQ8VXP7_9AGAR|nr:hypothetical protein C8R41DRAFT_862812 [Lentinula lateritia]